MSLHALRTPLYLAYARCKSFDLPHVVRDSGMFNSDFNCFCRAPEVGVGTLAGRAEGNNEPSPASADPEISACSFTDHFPQSSLTHGTSSTMFRAFEK